MSLRLPEFLAGRFTQPVAIFGGGVSGEGARTLLDALGVASRIYDAKGEQFSAEAARRHAVVVFSPGFVPEHPWLGCARAAGITCLGELDFASLFWSGPVVAITGTNGKTTLTQLLTDALRAAGRDAYSTGNIGHSFCALVAENQGGGADTTAVCEVSSFQAETLQHLRPAATLWTNFAEDHLERHAGLAAYFLAKWNLVTRTRLGAAFVGPSVARQAAALRLPSALIRPVETADRSMDSGLVGTVFAEYPQRENFLLAQAWWKAAGLPESALYRAAHALHLAPHRLAPVAELHGVTYWNDSKATNFHATEAALGRFTSPVVLIAGGKGKGGDVAGFVRRIAARVHHVALIGATAPELAYQCAAAGIPHTTCGRLSEAVHLAAQIAPRGGHVLLSPGFASLDQFRNYEDRGEQFEKLVRDLERCGEHADCVLAANWR